MEYLDVVDICIVYPQANVLISFIAGMLVEPIFEFAMSLSKLKLDKTEIALLAAVLLMQSGKFCLVKRSKIGFACYNFCNSKELTSSSFKSLMVYDSTVTPKLHKSLEATSNTLSLNNFLFL